MGKPDADDWSMLDWRGEKALVVLVAFGLTAEGCSGQEPT